MSPDTELEAFLRRPLDSVFANDVAEVVLPLSEVTRSFDGSGRCIGCAGHGRP